MSIGKVLSESHITMAELKDELAKIRKRDEELNFRAQRTEEYLQAVVTMKKKQAEDLKKAIIALEIPRIREEHATKIVDLAPETVEELKTVLAGYIITVSAENMKKIVDTVIAGKA